VVAGSETTARQAARGTASATAGSAGRRRGVGSPANAGHPGAATDASPPAAAAPPTASGQPRVGDRVCAARFGSAQGCDAEGGRGRAGAAGRELWLPGDGRPLHGAAVAAGDLRGGAALVVAALAARGQSRIAGCGYIDRGYPALEAMLARLGARIRREMPPKPAD